MVKNLTITLLREEHDAHWGFYLKGGSSPVLIKKVDAYSLAEKQGLLSGDILLKVNEFDLTDCSIDDAHNAIIKAGDSLEITLRRSSSGRGIPFCFPRRYQVALLAWFGTANTYMLRVNLSVAIVAMTSNSTIQTANGTETIKADFDWDMPMQGAILSAFFYGYLPTQMIGGVIACRYGGKNLFGAGIFVTAVCTLFTPWLANTNVYLLIGARFIEGFFEGFTFPSIIAFWSRWAPPAERTRIATLALSGCSFGTVLALPLCGFIAQHIGWPYIFYVFGAVGVTWSLLWCWNVSETPATDKHISQEEKEYILEAVGTSYNEKLCVPWKAIFTSLPVWGTIVVLFCENWGFYTMLTELPTFMNDVFGFKLQNTGLLSALPYVMVGFMIPTGGFLADWIRAKGYLNTTQVRKLFTCSAFAAQTVFLIAAAKSTTPTYTIAALTGAVGCGGFAASGYHVNQLDISGKYAGIVLGISNMFGTLAGIFTPMVASFIVRNKSKSEWEKVFFIAAFIYMIGCILYALLASGETQPWALDGKKPTMAELVEVQQDRMKLTEPSSDRV